MEAAIPKVKQLLRYETQGVITRINYVKDAQFIVISESSMFGFDWTGKVRIILDSEVLSQCTTGPKDYAKTAWSTIEYEHGVCSAEPFLLPTGVCSIRSFHVIN